MKRQRLSGTLGFSLAAVVALCVSSAVAVAAEVEVTPDVVYGHKYGMALTFDVLKPVDANGAAVLVISQDLEELFEIADRLSVIYEGHLSPARETEKLSVDEIGLLMGGVSSEPTTEVAAHAD